MAAVYLWLNSNWATQVPYLFSYGPEGAGKSLIATLIEKMIDIECLSATSTARSVRNEVNNLRFPEGYDGEESDCFFLVWDNVNLDTFNDPDMLGVFLQGAIKGKDIWKICSSTSGQNDSFRTFSPKVYSSVWPLHCDPKLKELTRRCIVLIHEKLDESELGERELLDIESIDFTDFFELKILNFYQDKERFFKYEEFKKAWKKQRKKGLLDSARKAIYADFAATGYIIGAWGTPAEAFNVINGYECFADRIKESSLSPLVQSFKRFIATEDGDFHNKDLDAHIELELGNHKLLEKPRTKEKLEAMMQLGYGLHNGMWLKQ
ncbi:hypothetical protein SPB21_27645 [Leptothoe sp. ISB3NOV94-8A]